MTLFEVMCSELESPSLRGISDVGLMGEVAALGIKVRVEPWFVSFLSMSSCIMCCSICYSHFYWRWRASTGLTSAWQSLCDCCRSTAATETVP